MMLRNEADIVQTNVRYHRSVGITDFFIIDNGSTDATPQMLLELDEEIPNLRWTRDDGAYQQGIITTGLAREAYTAGVDWVVAIDADEFWFPGDQGFQRVLAGASAAALEVDLITFVQDRRVISLGTDNVVSMTQRVNEPKVSPSEAQDAVESGQVAFVEMAYLPKWISRANAELVIDIGNHNVDGVDGSRSSTNLIQCFHTPLRAREVLHAKAEQGRRWREIGAGPEMGWHVQRWADLEDAGRLYDDWEANSWRMTRSGAVIDPPSGASPVMRDTRLRDLVRPFVPEQRSVFRRILGRRQGPG